MSRHRRMFGHAPSLTIVILLVLLGAVLFPAAMVAETTGPDTSVEAVSTESSVATEDVTGTSPPSEPSLPPVEEFQPGAASDGDVPGSDEGSPPPTGPDAGEPVVDGTGPTDLPITEPAITEPDGAIRALAEEELTISGFTVNMQNACAFMGGGNTVSGTIHLGRDPLTSTDYVSIRIYWQTSGPAGDVTWGSGFYPESAANWYEMPITVNGPWSISMPAYDPVVGGNLYGPVRPADATALVVSVVAGVYPKWDLGGTVYTTTEVVYSLAMCGEPSPTAVPVTPSPTVVPVTPSPTVVPVTPTPDVTNPPAVDGSAVPVSLAICANDACTPPHRPDADGFTATWEFTPLAEQQTAIRSFFQAAAPNTESVSAVVQNGMASALSPVLAAGSWQACLQPVLTRADGATIRLFNAPQCSTVVVPAAGDIDVVGMELPASVAILVEGAPTTNVPDGDGEKPKDTRDAGARKATGSSSTGSTSATTGLPVTGSGSNAGPLTDGTGWLLLGAAIFLLGSSALIRRRS